MEQCNPFQFVVFPLSKKILTANPGLWNQRGDVRDLATRGVERLNLQAVPREKWGKGDKKKARKAKGKENGKGNKCWNSGRTFFSAYIRVKLICNDFGWQKNRDKWSSDLFVLPSRDHPQPFTACSSGLCRAAVDLVSSSKGRDRQRPWDLKVGRVRKVRFGSTQQSNPDPSAHLARLATHWPEATNSAAARGLTPSML